jgi:hypothetical protein
LAGDYRLHLASTTGPSSGEWVTADLRLSNIEAASDREVVLLGIRDTTSIYALAGSTDLDPGRVGAVHTGELGSDRPDAPGVLVIEHHATAAGAPDIMLRLGADANRRGQVRYDGGYFALTVRGIGPRGFTGTWASGASGSPAAGYFCAERQSAAR